VIGRGPCSQRRDAVGARAIGWDRWCRPRDGIGGRSNCRAIAAASIPADVRDDFVPGVTDCALPNDDTAASTSSASARARHCPRRRVVDRVIHHPKSGAPPTLGSRFGERRDP
jgi:hypothetical protein